VRENSLVSKQKKGKSAKARRNRMAFWKERAQLVRLISHPVRLLILEALSDGSRCVKDLNSLVDVDQPNFSQHMAVLRNAELVGCHKSGALRCYYILRPSLVRNLISLLSVEHEVQFRDRDSVIRETE
jgi:ArsR family transcriptional regulator